MPSAVPREEMGQNQSISLGLISRWKKNYSSAGSGLIQNQFSETTPTWTAVRMGSYSGSAWKTPCSGFMCLEMKLGNTGSEPDRI